jgi:hypothetical protein
MEELSVLDQDELRDHHKSFLLALLMTLASLMARSIALDHDEIRDHRKSSFSDIIRGVRLIMAIKMTTSTTTPRILSVVPPRACCQQWLFDSHSHFG